MYKNLRPVSTSVYIYTIVYESIRTLVETFYEYIVCMLYEIFWNFTSVKWDLVFMNVLIQFEVNLRMYVEVARYSVQAHISRSKIFKQSIIVYTITYIVYINMKYILYILIYKIY